MSNKLPSINSMCWSIWHQNKNNSFPTQEEWNTAVKKYRKTVKEFDLSDYPSGLEFVMCTYSPEIWLKFFDTEEL